MHTPNSNNSGCTMNNSESIIAISIESVILNSSNTLSCIKSGSWRNMFTHLSTQKNSFPFAGSGMCNLERFVFTFRTACDSRRKGNSFATRKETNVKGTTFSFPRVEIEVRRLDIDPLFFRIPALCVFLDDLSSEPSCRDSTTNFLRKLITYCRAWIKPGAACKGRNTCTSKICNGFTINGSRTNQEIRQCKKNRCPSFPNG